MISIIVIGHNESWRLTKCINSIAVIIKSYPNIAFEVLYVDSNSKDDSIERASTLSQIKIIKITGEKNAAIARNIGAKESKGDILFFVDGDMELNPDFLKYAITPDKQLRYDVLTGHLDDYFYNFEGSFLGKAPRTYSKTLPDKVQELDTNGGIFLVNKKVWNALNGMNTKFKINEDIDFSLRLSQLKIKIQRLPYLITKHHTIDYRNDKRMWQNLKQGYGLYPGALLRTHVLKTRFLIKTVRSQYTALYLLLLLATFFIHLNVFLILILGYFVIMALRIYMHTIKANTKKNKILYFIERFFLQVSLDFSFWIGFLFFYPKNKLLQYKLEL